MGKRTTCSFGGFGTFVLLLYIMEVSSAPAVQDIVSVMKSDKNICKTAGFLYKSNYTENCAKYEYPNKDIRMKDYMNVLFCLAIYDASYKVCQYSSHWTNPFNSTAKFDAYIEKSYPAMEHTKEIEFCEKIQGVAPMYEKTKDLVVLLTNQLNNSMSCLSLCFGSEQGFNPLCAIIAWIKSVDDEVNKLIGSKETKKKNTPETKDVQSVQGKSVPVDNPTNSKGMEINNSNVEKNTSNLPNSSPKKSTNEDIGRKETAKNPEESELPVQHTSNNIHEKTEKAKTTSVTKIVDTATKPETVAKVDVPPKSDEPPYNQKNMVIPTSSALNIEEKKLPGDTETADATKHNTKNVPVNSGSVVNSVQEESLKVANDDTKTNTISDNTQEHEEKNEDPINFSDGISEQSFETGDQNHNMPEPSEQREMPHYHNLNPDDESHLFTYFTIMSLVCIAAYIGYHNKQKILAIVLEGRRSRNNRSRRRPSTASYRKLDCTLEEAVTSQCNANVTHVIY